MKAFIIRIEHNGHGFIDSDSARLIFTGVLHQYVLIEP